MKMETKDDGILSLLPNSQNVCDSSKTRIGFSIDVLQGHELEMLQGSSSTAFKDSSGMIEK